MLRLIGFDHRGSGLRSQQFHAIRSSPSERIPANGRAPPGPASCSSAAMPCSGSE